MKSKPPGDRPFTDPAGLGAALREVRVDLGWTQAVVAERAGISRALLIDLERGARPRAELNGILAVVRALGLAVQFAPDDRPRSLDEALDEVLG